MTGGTTSWARRARPMLGTLVEIGIGFGCGADLDDRSDARRSDQVGLDLFDAAFDELRVIEQRLSRFDPSSDLNRFHALRRGESMTMRRELREVLTAASELFDSTSGAFDISLGSAPQGCRIDCSDLVKLDDATRLDLGGIGKGYAVDRAVQLLVELGCAAGWVNAGGDLRSFGEVDVPVHLRDEASGGVRPFASLRDGAFATSDFSTSTRSRLVLSKLARSTFDCSTLARSTLSATSNQSVAHAPGVPFGAPVGDKAAVHASVAAPLCMWADALTKIVAITGNAAHPLLARYDAVAWIH